MITTNTLKEFNAQVLDKLNINQVLRDLQELIPYEIRYKIRPNVWKDPGYHIALVCYEKPSDFCHRHLVANWIERNACCKCEELKVGPE